MCFNVCDNMFNIAYKTELTGTRAVTFSMRFLGKALVNTTAV